MQRKSIYWWVVRVAAAGLRENKLRPVHAGARRFGWYGWESGTRRVGLQVAPAGQLGKLTIRRREAAGPWQTIALVAFEDWFVAVAVLASYGLIPDEAAGLYRRGHDEGRLAAGRAGCAR